MIDTHIHLESKEYNADCQEVIKRFFENGGKAIVNIGVDEERMKKALEIAASDQRIFVAIGFHPQEGTDLFIAGEKIDFIDILESLVKKGLLVPVGSGRGAYYEVSRKRLINGSNGSGGT